MNFVKIYFGDLCAIQADIGVSAVVVGHQETALHADDGRVAIAVGGIIFQQIAVFHKGLEATIHGGDGHIHEGQAPIFADCAHIGCPLGVAGLLGSVVFLMVL